MAKAKPRLAAERSTSLQIKACVSMVMDSASAAYLLRLVCINRLRLWYEVLLVGCVRGAGVTDYSVRVP